MEPHPQLDLFLETFQQSVAVAVAAKMAAVRVQPTE
jgi:hypothetical protein